MTFEEFMNLEVGDGINMGRFTGTIKKIEEMKKGDVIVEDDISFECELSYRCLHVAFYDRNNEKLSEYFPKVYTDFPYCIHNRSVLSDLSVWNPFEQN